MIIETGESDALREWQRTGVNTEKAGHHKKYRNIAPLNEDFVLMSYFLNCFS